MISLVPAMLRARRAQAVTVFLLSTVATAAAVAGPVALRVVDANVVSNEVASASVSERSISITGFADPSDNGAASQFTTVTNLLELPGFDQIHGGELTAFPVRMQGQAPDPRNTTRVVFRDDLCAHIVITSGRCLAGTYEVVIGEAEAKAAGVVAGDVAVLQASRYDGTTQSNVPDGPPTSVTVVGLYRPRQPDELYWASHNYFPTLPSGARVDPVLVNAPTFDLIGHVSGVSVFDSLAPPGLFTAARLATLKEEVNGLSGQDFGDGAGPLIGTSLPDLVDRINAGQRLAHQLVPVAFVPLVGLCWFVVFLAVGYGLTGRRHEIGLVSLRGIGRLRRAYLATGETLVAVIAGAPVGYVLGYVLVDVFARMRLGTSSQTVVSYADGLPWAAVAVAGAVVVALLGQWRGLAEPVADLLRGVPRRAVRWGSFAVEGLVVALAVVGVLQLRSSTAGLAGIGLLVPGLVLAAVAVVAARLFTPLAGAVARIALRRGWLGSGLAAIQVARRPGSQRLFALLAAAVGLLVYVSAATSVASLGRDERATVLAGATTVVQVDRLSALRALPVTHRLDPQGRWAMAVVPVEQSDSAGPALLAMDTARLAAVATWRDEYGVTPQALAAALAPPATTPMVLRGSAFTVDLRRNDDMGNPPATVTFVFASLTDGSIINAPIALNEGPRATYASAIGGCIAGCRLTGIVVAGAQHEDVSLTIYGMSTAEGVVIGPAQTAQIGRWRSSDGALFTPGQSGLGISTYPPPFADRGSVITVTDAPLPLPLAVTPATTAVVGAVHRVDGFSGATLEAHATVQPALLPRVGSLGGIVDLNYLLDVDLVALPPTVGEIWLGPAAPADAVAQLRAAGLSVLSVSTTATARTALARSGPALALQFHLAAAGLGILLALGTLGLVAAIDRRRRGEDLRALRRQGLPRRFVRRAALWGYLSLVVGSTVAGLVAAAIAWYLTGPTLPIFADTVAALPPPHWPLLEPVLRSWGAAGALLTVGSIVAGLALASTVRSRTRTAKG